MVYHDVVIKYDRLNQKLSDVFFLLKIIDAERKSGLP